MISERALDKLHQALSFRTCLPLGVEELAHVEQGFSQRMFQKPKARETMIAARLRGSGPLRRPKSGNGCNA